MSYDIEHPLIKDLMSPTVYTINSTESLDKAISMMVDHRISALVIEHHEDSRVDYYILTYRDIVEYLNQHNDQPILIRNEKIRELMKGPIELLSEEIPLDSLMAYMTQHGYKRVIVERDHKPVGVVSTTDILLWNNMYFKPGKPMVLAMMHNDSGIFIGMHIFVENIATNSPMNAELLDMIGGAFKSISAMLAEVMNQPGNLRELEKNAYVVNFEPRDIITGILICDRKSIKMRHVLHLVTNLFWNDYGAKITKWGPESGVQMIKLTKYIDYFK